MRVYFLILFTTCLVANINFAQDKIVLKSLDTIQVKVVEVTSSKTKYKKLNYLDGPSYTISNLKLQKIIFPDGSEENFDNQLLIGVESFITKKNALEYLISDITMMRIGLAFNRQFGNHFNLRVVGAFALDGEAYFRTPNKILNQISLQTLYFPYGHKRISFFTGLDLKYGDFYFESTTYYQNEYGSFRTRGEFIENFTRFGLMSGLEINLTQKFVINTFITFGTFKEVYSKKLFNKIDGGVGFGYKF